MKLQRSAIVCDKNVALTTIDPPLDVRIVADSNGVALLLDRL